MITKTENKFMAVAQELHEHNEVKTTFGGKNPYKMLKSYTFIDFVKFYEDRLAQTFYKVVRSMPSSINCPDYRTLISDMYARSLDRHFYQLKDNKAIGYDMLYNNSLTISLKTMQTRLFQRSKKRCSGLTKPVTIILKNKMNSGVNRTDKDLYSDYLLGVSARYNDDEESYIVKFGVATFSVVEKYIPKESSNDQVKVCIPDSEWSFISKTYKIKCPKTPDSEERKNNILNTGLDNIYFELQGV